MSGNQGYDKFSGGGAAFRFAGLSRTANQAHRPASAGSFRGSRARRDRNRWSRAARPEPRSANQSTPEDSASYSFTDLRVEGSRAHTGAFDDDLSYSRAELGDSSESEITRMSESRGVTSRGVTSVD